jgi:cytochrome c556
VSVSMRSAFAWALGATLVAGGFHAVSAQGPGGGRGALTPLVYRQNMMEQLAQSLTAMTAIQNGTVGAPGDLVGRAAIVRELAMALTSAFPAGSGGGESRSLPTVWENATEFGQRIQATQMAAETLLTTARGGNAEAIASAIGDVRQTCNACHETFRARPQGRGGN